MLATGKQTQMIDELYYRRCYREQYIMFLEQSPRN